MTKKSARFISDFSVDYMGKSPSQLSENLSKLMAKALEFHQICDKDIGFSMELLHSHDCQETRRIFIRSLPPYVEGALNFLRIIIYLNPPLLRRLPASYSAHFLEPFIELRTRSTIKDDIKKTFIAFGQVIERPFSNSIMGESGAQALIETFGLRDSLMHPCSVEGFTVTDGQLETARSGQIWFLEKFSSVFEPLIETTKKSTG